MLCDLVYKYLWLAVGVNNIWCVLCEAGSEVVEAHHQISGGLLFSLLLLLYSLYQVTSSSSAKSGRTGHFIGYSATNGMPMYVVSEQSGGMVQHKGSLLSAAGALFRSTLQHILEDAQSKRIFYYLCLNLVRSMWHTPIAQRLLHFVQCIAGFWIFNKDNIHSYSILVEIYWNFIVDFWSNGRNNQMNKINNYLTVLNSRNKKPFLVIKL